MACFDSKDLSVGYGLIRYHGRNLYQKKIHEINFSNAQQMWLTSLHQARQPSSEGGVRHGSMAGVAIGMQRGLVREKETYIEMLFVHFIIQ